MLLKSFLTSFKNSTQSIECIYCDLYTCFLVIDYLRFFPVFLHWDNASGNIFIHRSYFSFSDIELYPWAQVPEVNYWVKEYEYFHGSASALPNCSPNYSLQLRGRERILPNPTSDVVFFVFPLSCWHFSEQDTIVWILFVQWDFSINA
jgi:hypothetical protein